MQSATVATVWAGQPEVCKVDGYVPQNVGFSLVLPLAGWNGKYLQGGCAGAVPRLDLSKP